MTTYFTPVGTLPELTRAKGSQLNDREAAVTTGFTGLEAVIALTSGAASISYGTNWANVGSTVILQKTNGIVVLQGVFMSDLPSSATILTLPAGYRPSVNIYGLACPTIYDTTRTYTYTQDSVWSFGALNISTAGVISIPLLLNGSAKYHYSINVAFKHA